MTFQLSDRLTSVPPYIFSEINKMKAEATAKGIQLMSLAIGDPDLPTPEPIVKKMQEAIAKPENHGYSEYPGTLSFRTSVSHWFKKRFGEEFNPKTEIIALIGSKEGVAHFPLAFCNPGDRCLVPSPGYPVFESAVLYAGAKPIPVPHLPENDFLPTLENIETLFTLHRPKFILINSPSNPTSAVYSKTLLQEIVTLALKHRVIVVSDNAYAEVYYDETKKPVSIFELKGAREIAIEFHSFSKTFNMTGWRIGFALGNSQLVQGLLELKTHIDSGPLLSVQQTAEFCLENYQRLTDPIRAVYKDRRAVVLRGLDELKIKYLKPEATFFVWARTPKNLDSMEFTRALIETEGLVVTPGVGFGPEGKHFFRLALTQDKSGLEKAMGKLRDFIQSSE